MATTTEDQKVADRKAAKAQKDRERRARIKAEKEREAKRQARAERRAQNGGTRYREGGTPAEIIVVLTEAGEPLHVKEITERVMARGNAKLAGRTPQATVAAQLSVSIREPRSPFKKVKPGVFTVKPKRTRTKPASGG